MNNGVEDIYRQFSPLARGAGITCAVPASLASPLLLPHQCLGRELKSESGLVIVREAKLSSMMYKHDKLSRDALLKFRAVDGDSG
ncbi:hypothetical protein J6590_022968 [Homalodisca vitripennis]|nr:hypothetical protein J6590_022968 [Homalodisca vitripennis]